MNKSWIMQQTPQLQNINIKRFFNNSSGMCTVLVLLSNYCIKYNWRWNGKKENLLPHATAACLWWQTTYSKKSGQIFFFAYIFYSSHKISTMNSDDPLFGRFSNHSQMNRRRRKVSYPISLWKNWKARTMEKMLCGYVVFSSIIFDRESFDLTF